MKVRNYGKAYYFQGFLPTLKKNLLTSAKIGYHFDIYFGQTQGNELLSMCPKFEIKSFCGWDFNQGAML